MLFTVRLCTRVTKPLEIIVKSIFFFCVCFFLYVSMFKTYLDSRRYLNDLRLKMSFLFNRFLYLKNFLVLAKYIMPVNKQCRWLPLNFGLTTFNAAKFHLPLLDATLTFLLLRCMATKSLF